MIDANYYDGVSTRRLPVILMLHKRVIGFRGDGIKRVARLSQVRISERLEHAPRIVYFPEGDFIEVTNPKMFGKLNALLAENGFRDPWVVRWQQNWLYSLLALITLLAILASGYQWGLPWVSDKVAQHLPVALEKKIGDAELEAIDDKMMQASRLAQADQDRLQKLFSEMKQPRGDKTPYRLIFRHSKIGPNAFALPNGVIVMTDQLVMLARNDHAVLAVLGHELGHLKRRHSLRHLLQALGVGVMVNLFVGDVSSVLAVAPAFLLDQKYSRDFEREADLYAIEMMRGNGIPLTPMAELFEKMRVADTEGKLAANKKNPRDKKRGEQDGDTGRDDPLEYFSSHPGDAERIARLRAADVK